MKVFAALITMMIAIPSFAQVSADEIIKNYFETIGGEEAFRDLKGQKMVAEVDAQGMSIPLEIYIMADGKQITKMDIMGMSMSQDAFDGTVAWSTNFMTQSAEKAEAEESENKLRSIGEYPSPLLDYADKGYSVELLEDDVVDGVDCYKLKVTKKPVLVDGEEVENVEYFYFDQETFVPLKTESEMHSGPGKGEMMITLYSDYQEVDGLYFPFSMTFKSEDSDGQLIEFDEIILNPVVEEGFFSFPTEE
ncbi:MAG: outer membrane lipoprotein-sorting protein [Crocinitomicaceae bacterium]|nr:outer membrane lipoprotein-sorting protein [Flavobacteriales bacterium]NQZ37690.1 outer membrane lipoprotein-sorting protein [Crocinitomicaceae bacterium]